LEPCRNKSGSKAYEPYGKLISPVSVLFLDMPDMDFDVNVHPAKKKFVLLMTALFIQLFIEPLEIRFKKNHLLVEPLSFT
jgi:DNA mismatch repair protein MutL